MCNRKILSILFVMFIVSVCSATTYYVSTDGDNAGNGLSWDQAFETVQYAVSTAVSLDVIEVNEGTYTGVVDCDDKTLYFTGTDPNDWSVVENTIIDIDDYSTDQGFILDGDSTITGLTITGADYGIIARTGNGDILISKCIVHGNDRHGIDCQNLNSVTIENCKVYDNGGHMYHYGILIKYTDDAIVRNNIIYNNDQCGLYVGTYNPAQVSNNTIVDHFRWGIHKPGEGSPAEPVITNCIVWDCNDDISNCSAIYSCISDGNDTGTGNIYVYPYFANFNDNDFNLRWNSPCINRGDPNGTYTGQTDIDSEDRIYMDLADIGADEVYYGVNLVQNPGFEEGLNGQGVPMNWNKKIGTVTYCFLVKS